MKTISSKSWGADRDIFLNTYKPIIQSKLDYGAILYGSAKENILRTLNSIETTALRLAIGTFRSSTNNSVLAESIELPREQRRIGLILSYTPPNHHLPELSPSTMSTFENRSSLPKPLLLRQKHYNTQLELETFSIHPRPINPFPPWKPPNPKIDYGILNSSDGKKNTPTGHYKNLYHTLINENYSDHKKIFTDGTIIDEKRGCAVTSEETELLFALPKAFSIMSYEAFPILQALQLIEETVDTQAAILTDSKSTLDVLPNALCTNPIIQTIQLKIEQMQQRGRKVLLIWIPSHQGIYGNERADTAAKNAALHGTNATNEIQILKHEHKKSYIQSPSK